MPRPGMNVEPVVEIGGQPVLPRVPSDFIHRRADGQEGGTAVTQSGRVVGLALTESEEDIAVLGAGGFAVRCSRSS
jgi:hypothetical protein